MMLVQVFEQVIAVGMILSTALIIWESLLLLTGSESPIVVVLRSPSSMRLLLSASFIVFLLTPMHSGSMDGGFSRGDLLLLYQSAGACYSLIMCLLLLLLVIVHRDR